MTISPIIKGQPLPADWKVVEYFGPERILRPGDLIVFAADRALHEDDALAYRDLLVTRSRAGAWR